MNVPEMPGEVWADYLEEQGLSVEEFRMWLAWGIFLADGHGCGANHTHPEHLGCGLLSDGGGYAHGYGEVYNQSFAVGCSFFNEWGGVTTGVGPRSASMGRGDRMTGPNRRHPIEHGVE